MAHLPISSGETGKNETGSETLWRGTSDWQHGWAWDSAADWQGGEGMVAVAEGMVPVVAGGEAVTGDAGGSSSWEAGGAWSGGGWDQNSWSCGGEGKARGGEEKAGGGERKEEEPMDVSSEDSSEDREKKRRISETELVFLGNRWRETKCKCDPGERLFTAWAEGKKAMTSGAKGAGHVVPKARGTYIKDKHQEGSFSPFLLGFFP